jgi:dissimilatory sulfite reductase (desulfoviridin) alpha/beta subunit
MANESYDLKNLKSGGFMKQKEKDLFSVRLRVIGGYIRSNQLTKLVEIANKYGKGHLHLTTRQGIEIPYVHFNDFDKLRQELAEVDLAIGACGPRVRTITACQGEICSHGLISPQELARIIDEKFFGRSGYPHKFKIGIAGCPNSCTKPYENDFGIMGTIEKDFIAENCNGCGLCLEVCPIQTIYLDNENIARYDPKKCIGCGECVFICPTGAWEKKREGYVIFVGGRMGKFPKLGVRLGTVWEKETLFSFLEKTLEFYKREGIKGERFGETLERLGLEYYKEKIFCYAKLMEL